MSRSDRIALEERLRTALQYYADERQPVPDVADIRRRVTRSLAPTPSGERRPRRAAVSSGRTVRGPLRPALLADPAAAFYGAVVAAACVAAMIAGVIALSDWQREVVNSTRSETVEPVAQLQRPKPDDDDGYHPLPSGTPGVLAEGRHFRGAKWQLMAYDSNEGLCIDLRPHGTGGTHGACGVELTKRRRINWVRSRDHTGEYVYGTVASDAAEVRVRSRHEVVQVARVIPGPEGSDSDTSFFVAVFPPGSPATHIRRLEAIAADGSVVASVDLPLPPIINPWADPP